MTDSSRPALASVTIRRLVLRGGEAGPGLGDAIAAALARELGTGGLDSPPPPGVAQSIARGIVGHADLAGRRNDGGH